MSGRRRQHSATLSMAARNRARSGRPSGGSGKATRKLAPGVEYHCRQALRVGGEELCGGHRVSAREAYLRACIYYHTSFVFLFGTPVDQRLIGAFDKEVEAFEKAAALFEQPVEPVEIPYEGTTLPGYFYRVDDSGRPRPTVIATNGYDSTIQAMHFGHAVAAVSRGYNCLLFDGPGQGRVLYKRGYTCARTGRTS